MIPLLGEEALTYLADERFSAGTEFKLNHSGWYENRGDLLEEIAAKRNVLHIGCADHEELIIPKHARGEWLHGRLAKVANDLWGIDIAPGAIAVAKTLGFENICLCNLAERWPEELDGKYFDVAILGEIVEHLNDPIGFLSKLRENSAGRIKSLVVTVPNAWAVENAFSVLGGVEFINTDHRFWFTPFTITKVLLLAGWRVDAFWFCQQALGGGLRNRLKAGLLRRFPQLAEGIVVRAAVRT